MNKILLTAIFLLTSIAVDAQWVNSGTYLSTVTDNIGIGTSTPSSLFHVKGTDKIAWFEGTGSGVDVTGRIGLYAHNAERANIKWYQISNSTYQGALSLNTHGSDGLKARMYIDPNGKIGIGTSSPSSLLTLRKSAASTDLEYQNSMTSRTWKLKMETNGIFKLWGSAAGDVMSFQPVSGNVGIGTDNPNSILHIENSAPVVSAKATNLGSGLRFNVIDQNSDLYRFQKDGVTQWTMKSNGSIGIGTGSTGSHKLAVDGSIGAREVVVETGAWSDFVFDDNYQLRSLEETEQFISENNHLPEIPTESEVKENGINLGEMDAKLLQKIEELTLYLIDQNKQIQDLKKEVARLK